MGSNPISSQTFDIVDFLLPHPYYTHSGGFLLYLYMAKKVKGVDGFRFTTSIKKLRRLKSRVRVVPGGTSAGF